ncbi:MAG: prephenate dehydrogenase [Armatimonadota bacterium]
MAVIGTGLIGGSMCLALRKRGLAEHIVGVARTEETRQTCLERGIVDEATDDPAQAAAGAELVYVASPLPTCEHILRLVGPVLHPEALLTDAGSVKAPVLAQAEELLPRPEQFVAGHPMAGSEESGAGHAEADLFEGRPYFLTPGKHTEEPFLEGAKALAEAIGSRAIVIAPELHDEVVAAVSHVPHLTAAALADLVFGEGEEMEIRWQAAGPGFLDTTRVAAGPGRMWREIVEANRGNVAAALGELVERVQRVKGLIEREEWEELEGWLRRVAERRRGVDDR